MNYPKVFILAAIAATAIFSANKASAVMGMVNISATATFEVDSSPAEGSDVFQAVKPKGFSFKNADVLALLQTAVQNTISDAGDVTWFTTKGSQLVYDPDAYNPEASAWYGDDVYGIFWVTNKTTQSGFRLDGSSDNGSNYWSFVELDFAPWFLGTSAISELNLNGVHNGKYVASPYQYSDKITGNATFYIHDDPYDVDYPHNLDAVVFDPEQNFAVVLTGTMTYSFSYKFDAKTGLYDAKNSFSLKGSGDGLWNDSALLDQGYLPQPIFSGSVKHSDSGKEAYDVPPAPAF